MLVVMLKSAEVTGEYTILFKVQTGHASIPQNIEVEYSVANIDASWLPATDEQVEKLREYIKRFWVWAFWTGESGRNIGGM